MKVIKFLIVLMIVIILSSCSENYSNGDRVGVITKFSESGILWKSYEGELNVTQTGMNTSSTFQFSLDNDEDNIDIANKIKLCLKEGYKVKLTYHQVKGWNWFSNRGKTDYFILNCQILNDSINNIIDTPLINDSVYTPYYYPTNE